MLQPTDESRQYFNNIPPIATISQAGDVVFGVVVVLHSKTILVKRDGFERVQIGLIGQIWSVPPVVFGFIALEYTFSL